MSFQINCPCGTQLACQPEHMGQTIMCPNCKQKLQVGQAAAPPQQSHVQQQRPPQQRPPQPQQQQQRPHQQQPAPQQQAASPSFQKQTGDSNKTLIIGGLLAITVVALAIVSLAGMYMFSGDNKKEEVATSEPASVPKKNLFVNRTTAPAPETKRSPTRESAPSSSMDLADLIERVEPSVVRLDVKSNEGESIGSGVFVEGNYIVTNFHVVQGAYEITVTSNDGKETKAKGFCHADPLKDLAVIRIPDNVLPEAPLPLAQVLPRKGEDVAAFGSPLGFSFTATEGVVSSIRNGKEAQKALSMIVGADIYSALGYSTKTNWIQTTAAISGGNSGGPLVDMEGNLVGINTWTHPEGQNLNFAATVDEVRTVLQVAQRSDLKRFASLPKKRIEIVFRGPPAGSGGGRTPSRRPNSRGGSRGNLPSGGSQGRIGIPGINIPGMNIPGPSFGGGIPGRGIPGGNISGGSSGTTRELTAEEREALNARREADRAERELKNNGTENVVIVDEGPRFATNESTSATREFDGQAGGIVDVAVSKDNKFMAAVTDEGTVLGFDFRQGTLLYKIESEGKLIRKVRFANDPTRLVTIRDQGGKDTVVFRDADTGEVIRKGVEYQGNSQANVAAVSSDGQFIFAGWSSPLHVKFWRMDGFGNSSTMSVRRAFGSGRTAVCATFSKDDKFLLAGFNDGWISASAGSGSSLGTAGARQIHEGIINAIAVSTTGKKVVSGGEDGQVSITSWGTKNWNSGKLGEAGSEVLGVDYSDNDQVIVASRSNRKIEFYGVRRRGLISTITCESACNTVQFFGSDRFVVAGGNDGVIRIYEAPAAPQ